MKFEAVGPDGKVKATTHYIECIEIDTIDCRARAGYKFKLDGKIVSPTSLKAFINNAIGTAASSDATLTPSATIGDNTKRSVKSIICINNGKTYKNMSEAGRDLGIDSALISYSLKVGRPTKGYSFAFVE